MSLLYELVYNMYEELMFRSMYWYSYMLQTIHGILVMMYYVQCNKHKAADR